MRRWSAPAANRRCTSTPGGTFAVRTDTARLLQAFTPGGLEEGFRSPSEPAAFDGLPPAPEGPPSPEAVETMAARFADHGVEFTGPPLAARLAAGR